MRALIRLHKETPALWADAPMRVINAGYPFVFERTDGEKNLLVAINPSDTEHTVSISETRPIIAQNAILQDGILTMQGISFYIGEKQ